MGWWRRLRYSALTPQPHARHLTASARIFVLLILLHINFEMVLEQEQEKKMAIALVASLQRDARPHGLAAPNSFGARQDLGVRAEYRSRPRPARI